MFYFVFSTYYPPINIIIMPMTLSINYDLDPRLQALALAELPNTLAQTTNLTIEVKII